MIKTTAAYQKAIVGSPRRIYLRAIVDLSDPEMELGTPSTSPQSPWGRPAQLIDRIPDAPPRYGTLEEDYWRLDGSFDYFPAAYQITSPVGTCGNLMSGPDGSFQAEQTAQVPCTGVSIMQNVSVIFSDTPGDGVGEDFILEIYRGGTLLHQMAITGNKDPMVALYGYTVENPTRILLRITKWSLPYRYCRIMEFRPGLFERWDFGQLSAFSVTQQGDFSCLTIPYGSARLTIDNQSRRFDPRNKEGIFQSITDRQGMELLIGPELADGTIEYVSVGTYHMSGDGWKASSNDPTMNWELVDILGLLRDRQYLLPRVPSDPLPNTLGGWVAACMDHLGKNFAKRYRVDPNYADKEVTALTRKDVTGKTCGDILRWACMAAGTWPRMDAWDGYLTVEPLWNQGNKVDLDNLEAYPDMGANKTLSMIIFKLSVYIPEDEPNTEAVADEYVVYSEADSAADSVTVQNPFIHTPDQALAAAKGIFAWYGGTKYELVGRGDPSSEIGDVDTIWLDKSHAATARRSSQTFNIQDGVLRSCRSTLIQGDQDKVLKVYGYYLLDEYEIITESGTYNAPTGVSDIRFVIIQGGQGGSVGAPGYIYRSGNLGNGMSSGYGDKGIDGAGGLVTVVDLEDIEENLPCTVVIGKGGAASDVHSTPGEMGGHSSLSCYLGTWSSEEGEAYDNGYTVVAHGLSFARTGVEEPLDNTGDGGSGGAGGDPGEGYLHSYSYTVGGTGVTNTATELIVTKSPGPGHPGKAGSDGLILVTWGRRRRDDI